MGIRSRTSRIPRCIVPYLVLAVAFVGGARAAIVTDVKHVAALREGVRSLGVTGSPGVVCAFGEDAFVVVAGRVGGRARAPVVAASTLGDGRVVAFAHTGYFSPSALAEGDGTRLMTNSVRWTARKSKGPVHVGVLGGSLDFVRHLIAQDLDAVPFEALAAIEKSDLDVLVHVGSGATSAADLVVLARWIKRGGGLLVAETPWGWMQLHPGRSLIEDHAGNRILNQAGLAWIDGYAGETSAGRFDVDDSDFALVNGSRAVLSLAPREGAVDLSPDAIEQARWSILAAMRATTPEDKLFRPRLARLTARGASAIPTSSAPLGVERGLDRLFLSLEIEAQLACPAAKVRALPAAASFPGLVPEKAARVVRAVDVDLRVPGWHSTGVYAAAGETIEITISASAATKGLVAQIGAHTDDLTDLPTWRRAPRLVRRQALEAEATRVASPFGGIVYVVVPDAPSAESVSVKFRNVVEAPRFVLGATDPTDWRDRIRSAPAPWAEIETKKVVITLPAEHVRALDDPVAVATFWDSVLDACADLAGISRDRTRPERYVCDEQISAGYMHSGYPILTHLDVAPTIVDVAKLRANADGCGWGFYHEMGHNHQRGEWTFEGTGEVTNNLFTVYVLDTVVKAQDERTSPAKCKARFDEYARKGAKYEEWKSDPFLALGFFLEMQRAFGWPAFQAFFAEYRALKKRDRPVDDEDERDQWLVRLSRITGRDLGPWFALWNVPVRPEARAQVRGLPEWMPAGYGAGGSGK